MNDFEKLIILVETDEVKQREFLVRCGTLAPDIIMSKLRKKKLTKFYTDDVLEFIADFRKDVVQLSKANQDTDDVCKIFIACI